MELDLGDARRGILGIETRYQERPERREPKPERLARYVQVAERSRLFLPGALEAVNGTDLLVMWLEHLLVQSMLQHSSGTWRWGRLVDVHPAVTTPFADACSALPSTTASAIRRRYVST